MRLTFWSAPVPENIRELRLFLERMLMLMHKHLEQVDIAKQLTWITITEKWSLYQLDIYVELKYLPISV